ncbi:toll/interleukin-1 receptor domain-containing protein [Flavobacterium amniphilum]|uniref:toll/interleukin-1 receptor domain-containing protein n=1 Tax=Flavobacterium amniphilum TaxID=1834035 RepID=UPI00202A78AA|nr:toll/interleukin-1 receptor domain-containing protein [Flavobacterium amniphilum]MCL9804611.1 toll/interleukin-1 receptor domain-containing protein [Flavobacterium amniphilum]
MTELQEKIESFQNLLIDIATSGNRSEEEGNFKQSRTELIGNNEIKDLLPDFVKTNRTVAQFWQYIKGQFSTYKERRTFIWTEFAKTLDHIEAKQNGIINNVETSNQTETLKDKLIKILGEQKEIGDGFLLKIDSISNMKELDDFLIEYDNWNMINTDILDKAYVQKQLFQIYSGASNYLGNVYVEKNSFQDKRNRVLYCLPRQLGHLKTAIDQTQNLQNTDLLPIDNQPTTTFQQQSKTQNKIMSKLFISHSSEDKEKIKPLIDLIENIGVSHNQFFFSSHPAYGVDLGQNIFERLKTELEDNVFALFVLSDNFYKSPVCLCEMGAVWIKSNKQIPILIPPFDFKNVQGVFPNSLGFKMNDKDQLNSFKGVLETHFNLTPIHISRWEEKRDEYLTKINGLLK